MQMFGSLSPGKDGVLPFLVLERGDPAAEIPQWSAFRAFPENH